MQQLLLLSRVVVSSMAIVAVFDERDARAQSVNSIHIQKLERQLENRPLERNVFTEMNVH